MPGKVKVPATREVKTCQACGGTNNQMYACDRCYLATYCSSRCSLRDWANHKEDCRFITWHRKHAGRKFCHSCFAHTCAYAHTQLKRCGGCLRVSYCSQQCQEDDWIAHVAVCTNDKNRKSSETLRSEAMLKEIQASHEHEMAERLAEIQAEAEEKRNKRARKRVLGLESDEDSSDESPVSKEQRLKVEIQNKCRKELSERMRLGKEDPPPLAVNRSGSPEPEVWEKKWKQSKTLLGTLGKGKSKPHSPMIQETEYRIRISNKPPDLHSGYVRNADNTMSYEQEVKEVQPDGSVIYRKQITTNGVFENDEQMRQLAKTYGVDFKLTRGKTLATVESDSD